MRLPKKWEGSKGDKTTDRKGAKAAGVTVKQYERSPPDKREDARNQAKLDKARKAR